jgi:hypothetical protein
MGRFRKFLGLAPRQRWLLIKAAALLATVRLSLWLLPFPTARALFDVMSRRSRRLAADPIPVVELAGAVEVASRFVPWAHHCLTKALTGRIFLIRHGHPAEVRYGVARDAKEDFLAHAWLESEGRVVIGGSDLGRYATLSPPVSPHE